MRIICLALLAILSLTLASQTAKATENKTVIRVVSGDTFIVEGGQAVRLMGVLAPSGDQFYAQESQQALTNFLLGQEVELEKDNKNIGIGHKDTSGRQLCYVHLASDHAFINQLMISQGYGFFNDRNIQTFRNQFLTDQQAARRAHLGVWEKNELSPIEQAEHSKTLYTESVFEYKSEYKSVDLRVQALWAKKADPRVKIAHSIPEAELLAKLYQDSDVSKGKVPPLLAMRKNLAQALTEFYQEQKVKLRIETNGDAAEVLRFVGEGMDQNDADHFCGIQFNRELFAGLEFTEVIFTDDDKFTYSYKVAP